MPAPTYGQGYADAIEDAVSELGGALAQLADGEPDVSGLRASWSPHPMEPVAPGPFGQNAPLERRRTRDRT